MIQFDLPKQKSSIIKVLGVGGGGSNAVNHMFKQNIDGVDFIICNTDAKAIEQSEVPNKIQLGPHLTQGLGAGADPSVGKMATEESLEEIRKILEVNTRMAFITVGMGGGTGTGGAPIIAQICKDLGILTVGIVTTPFGFEGPRRQKQAQEGINQLKPYVDTLLVISNDKLRVQYGNLKMKEAFTKADNVLATAAKCITDVINSRGHIIVDFADVCTVMKNGGVAILGKAEVEGENRAVRAIEEALSSPLLNDNDIKGAKWILLNINSAEGEYECSMDELESINNILRERTGENTDVIMGMGYEEALGAKLGITLVATGFDAKDPFKKEEPKKEAAPVEEKIVMTLHTEQEVKEVAPIIAEVKNEVVIEEEIATAPVAEVEETMVLDTTIEEPVVFNFNDHMVEESLYEEEHVNDASIMVEAAAEIETFHEEELMIEQNVVEFDLAPTLNEYVAPSEVYADMTEEEVVSSIETEEEQFVLDMEPSAPQEFVLNKPTQIYAVEATQEVVAAPVIEEMPTVVAVSAPVEVAEVAPVVAVEEKPFESSFRMVVEEEAPSMQLVMKEETVAKAVETSMPIDETEDQRRKVAERIQKLRNLSFNINNGADPSMEFDAVPAYVRRNLDLFGNTLASVENYYSKYTVDKDENNQTQISTINTFLDGKKPD
jgi:cell division protein FtsZ